MLCNQCGCHHSEEESCPEKWEVMNEFECCNCGNSIELMFDCIGIQGVQCGRCYATDSFKIVRCAGSTERLPVENLPSWASTKASGCYLELNAQLCTRDGRRVGNGFIKFIDDTTGTAIVLLESGRELILNNLELIEFFYRPKYIKKVNLGLGTITGRFSLTKSNMEEVSRKDF